MAVVAKGKQRRSAREEDKDLEQKVVVRQKPSQDVADSRVKAGDVRAVLAETFARIRSELWSSTTTHDELGNVDAEISEEAYIVMLTMVVGNDNFLPRQGLKMREVEISDTARYCREHR